MSEDAAVEGTPAPEAPEASAAPANRRGRPRPQSTIGRDDQVLELLRSEGPMTKKEIGAKLGWEDKIVYGSLWRLRHYGNQAEKVAGSSQWQAAAS